MKRKRMLVDATMIVALPLLMAYSLVGEAFHEYVGVLMLAAFVAHHVLNRGWWRGLRKGAYGPLHLLRLAVDLLLLVFMVLQPLTGILMSKHLFAFVDLDLAGATAWARSVHLPLAYWGLCLMSLHAGMHVAAPLKRLRRQRPRAFGVVRALWMSAALWGCVAFVRRQMPGYLFGRISFAFYDFSEPRVFFFVDYVAVMLLWALVGCGLTLALQRVKRGR